jgi:hypothetical protein
MLFCADKDNMSTQESTVSTKKFPAKTGVAITFVTGANIPVGKTLEKVELCSCMVCEPADTTIGPSKFELAIAGYDGEYIAL